MLSTQEISQEAFTVQNKAAINKSCWLSDQNYKNVQITYSIDPEERLFDSN